MKKYTYKIVMSVAASFFGITAMAQCPSIICPTNITVNNDLGSCDAVVNYTTPIGNDPCDIGTQTFNYTGGLQMWTVPTGVTSINVDAYGAAGANSADGGIGANGGRVQADLAVTPGQILNIYVGGAGSTCLICPTGGYNGGGGTNVYNTSQHAGTGGGASDIRIGGINLTDRVVVAGGGGGGGFTGTTANGGAGGGLVGSDGSTWSGYPAGTGGTQSAGGNGGDGSTWGQPSASPGTLGNGGQGEGWSGGGGGGGGGYFGGGGAFISGGGGGSSYTSGIASNIIHTQGVQTGNGQLIISYTSTTITTTQTAGLSSGATFPIGITTNTYSATNGFGTVTCSFTVTVVNPLPTAAIGVFSPDTICDTDPVVSLPIGTPASGTYSGNGVTGANFDPALAGIGTHYVYYNYTDSNTCSSSDSTLIVVITCVGINENTSLTGVSVFPNPANNVINISLGEANVVFNFTLTSIDGKVVYQAKNSTDKTYAIDISNFSKGVYFLRVDNINDYKVFKVIKQ